MVLNWIIYCIPFVEPLARDGVKALGSGEQSEGEGEPA